MATGSTGPVIIGVAVTFEAIAITAVALRFWSQRSLKREIFAHDIWIAIGFICTTAISIICILNVVLGGLGQHANGLYATSWKIEIFQKLQISLQTCWACGMTSIRTSIILLYTHLFSTDRRFRMACYTALTINILWFVGDICVVWLICLPAESYWDSSIQPDCGNISAAYLAIHVSNLMVDILVAALPAQVLWHLQMPVTRKLGIIAMFALVALICAIAIARIATWRIALGLTSDDFTYTGSTLYLFSAIDVSVLCALACMSLLKPAGEKLASSSTVAWTSSLFQNIQSKAIKASTGQHGRAKSRSVQRPYPESPAFNVDSESSEGMDSNQTGLVDVYRRVERHTYLSNDSLEMEP